MATYLLESAASGQIQHRAGSAGAGTHASLAAFKTAYAPAGADLVYIYGSGLAGNGINTGLVIWDTAFAGILLVDNPVIYGSPGSGTVAVWEFQALVPVSGNHAIENRSSVGRGVAFNCTANDVAIDYSNGTIRRHGGGGSPWAFVQTASFRATGRLTDCHIDAGNNLADGFSGTGAPATPGQLEFIRCTARGCNNAFNSNGFSMDGSFYTTLYLCEDYNSGGPAFVGNISASFVARMHLVLCSSNNSCVAVTTVGTTNCAAYCTTAIGCTFTNCLGGIRLATDVSNTGMVAARDCIISRDTTRFTGVSDNLSFAGIRVESPYFAITGCVINDYRWTKSLSDVNVGQAAIKVEAPSFYGVIAGCKTVRCATSVWVASRDGTLLEIGNQWDDEDGGTCTSAAIACSVLHYIGATAGNLKVARIGNRTRTEAVSGASSRPIITATNVTNVLSVLNYDWGNGALSYSGWTAGGSDVSSTAAGQYPAYEPANAGISPITDAAHSYWIATPEALRGAELVEANISAVLGVPLTGQLALASAVAAVQAAATAIQAKTDQLTFTGADVKATLDSETVTCGGGKIDYVEGNVDPGLILGDGCQAKSVTGDIGGKVRGNGLSSIDGVGVRTENGSTILASCQDTNTKVGTALSRLGAWTGTGVNTILGAIRAIANKVAGIATPSDLTGGGGTFDNQTDSLEATRDRGDSSWSGTAEAAAIWSYADRTLTMPAVQLADLSSGSTLVLLRGDTWTIALTGLGSIADRDKLYFGVKADRASPDSEAEIQVEETAGLLIAGRAAAAEATDAAITVDDEDAGDITITVKPAATKLVEIFARGFWDIQVIRDVTGAVNTLAAGRADLVADVNRTDS